MCLTNLLASFSSTGEKGEEDEGTVSPEIDSYTGPTAFPSPPLPETLGWASPTAFFSPPLPETLGRAPCSQRSEVRMYGMLYHT